MTLEPKLEEVENRDSLTYLALGDSYTIGQSVEEADRYPVKLVDGLRSSALNVKDPKIIARTGWTTSDLIEALNEVLLRPDYNLVTLLIGVNNQYQRQPIELYEEEFRQLLDRAILYANGVKEHVFVLSIPDYAYTPFGQATNSDEISKEIDEYNAINQRITEEKGVEYIYITTISRLGLADKELVAKDGLHPSGKMYEQWVNELLPKVLKVLNP